MSRYPHYTYYLQKDLTHFGVKVSTHFGLGVSGQFGIENHKRKINNIHQDYQFFMNNILCRNP